MNSTTTTTIAISVAHRILTHREGEVKRNPKTKKLIKYYTFLLIRMRS